MNNPQIDQTIHRLMPDNAALPNFTYDLNSLKIDDTQNFVDWLFKRQTSLDKPLFILDENKFISYAKTQEIVCKIANILLQNYGLKSGNRVLIRGVNSAMMAMIFLGVVKAGLIAVATMPLLRKKELGQIIEKSTPVLAFCDTALRTELDMAFNEHKTLQHVVYFSAKFTQESQDTSHLESMLTKTSAYFAPSQAISDDIALIAFTSGTTGTPKAVAHSHRNVICACLSWPVHILKQQSSDIVLGSPPLAFTFGLGGLLLFPMMAGAKIYYPNQAYSPQLMVETIERVGATICYTAPTFYNQMIEHIKSNSMISIRESVSAGEPLSQTIREQWQEATGLKMLDGIGATEMFHIFISASGDSIRKNAIGKIVPGYHAKIVDKLGHEVPHGTIGQLAVIGPTGCTYIDDDRQKDYVKQGWNYPGDSFTADADGYYYYQSRSDDMIISSGYNISCIEVEEIVNKHPEVLESAVIGVKDELRGHVVKAFVVTKKTQNSHEQLIKSIQKFVKQEIAPYKYPRQIEFIKQLPKTPTGKLQRFALK